MELKLLEKGDPKVCEEVLRSLPEWFGLEEAIVSYIEESKKIPMLYITDKEKLVGFVSIKVHSENSAELYVMGIKEAYHRKGIGRKLVSHVEKYLFENNIEFFQVKTLSPERESDHYKKTRLFYKALGFRELEVFPTLWDKENPCLLLVKHIQRPSVFGQLHHVEIYVSNLDKSRAFWSWFLEKLNYSLYQEWSGGFSMRLGETYVVFVQVDTKFIDSKYHRCNVGLNHLAFHGESKKQIDELTSQLKEKGINILYKDKHPHAGGENSYAVYFEDPDRIKVEVQI